MNFYIQLPIAIPIIIHTDDEINSDSGNNFKILLHLKKYLAADIVNKMVETILFQSEVDLGLTVMGGVFCFGLYFLLCILNNAKNNK